MVDSLPIKHGMFAAKELWEKEKHSKVRSLLRTISKMVFGGFRFIISEISAKSILNSKKKK